jgi:hypothetical protein
LLTTIAEFVDCEFVNNEAYGAAAVFIQYDAFAPLDPTYDQPRFVNCKFTGNVINPGITEPPDIIHLNYCDQVEFDACLIADNHLVDYGPNGSVVGGDFGGSFLNCTIVNNTHGVGTGWYGIFKETDGSGRPLSIENTIVAFNGGPAVKANWSSGALVDVSKSNFHGNEEWTNDRTDTDWLSIGQNMANADPAFCDPDNGDYSLYAFSPCAPGVTSPTLIGAKEIACVPDASYTVNTDSLNGAELILVACPRGDALGYHVNVDLDESVVTRTIQPHEFTMAFQDFSGSVYDDDGAVTAIIPADTSNSYTTQFSHRWFGGYGSGLMDVILNGALLVDDLYINLRTPDEAGGPTGKGDGVVDLTDMSAFTNSYTSPPNDYVAHRDYTADGAIDIADFSVFAQHYLHEALFDLLPLAAPAKVATSDIEVNLQFAEEYVSVEHRELQVRITLSNIGVFKAMCISLKDNNPKLRFERFEPNNTHPKPIIATPVTRDNQSQVFVGIMGSKDMLGSTFYVGTAFFEIDGTDELQLDSSDFDLLIGDVLSVGGGMSAIAGAAVNKAEEIVKVYHNSLSQNFPNPFNPETTIQYSIAKNAHVKLHVFNVRGQLVRTLADERKPKNIYTVTWDGRNDAGIPVATGVYFYKLTAGDFTQTKKMILLK